MTYNVFGGTLSLPQSINCLSVCVCLHFNVGHVITVLPPSEWE